MKEGKSFPPLQSHLNFESKANLNFYENSRDAYPSPDIKRYMFIFTLHLSKMKLKYVNIIFY